MKHFKSSPLGLAVASIKQKLPKTYGLVQQARVNNSSDNFTRHGVVCLCGSGRAKYRDNWQHANELLTQQGLIVVTVGIFKGASPVCDDYGLDIDHSVLADLHYSKIAISDAVVVLTPDGYLGEQTTKEVKYAVNAGIPVYFIPGYLRTRVDINSHNNVKYEGHIGEAFLTRASHTVPLALDMYVKEGKKYVDLSPIGQDTLWQRVKAELATVPDGYGGYTTHSWSKDDIWIKLYSLDAVKDMVAIFCNDKATWDYHYRNNNSD